MLWILSGLLICVIVNLQLLAEKCVVELEQKFATWSLRLLTEAPIENLLSVEKWIGIRSKV